MDFGLLLLIKSKGFQPKIGEKVTIILGAEALLCTYLGLKICSDFKCKHIYQHKDEVLEAVSQLGLEYHFASSFLN